MRSKILAALAGTALAGTLLAGTVATAAPAQATCTIGVGTCQWLYPVPYKRTSPPPPPQPPTPVGMR
jgi:hypothetical protein